MTFKSSRHLTLSDSIQKHAYSNRKKTIKPLRPNNIREPSVD